MELTLKERIIIANQLLILEALYPKEASDYAKNRKAIEDGYTLNYNWISERFSQEMAEEDCKTVWNILEMYRSIVSSYDKLADKAGIAESAVRFRGFDGNDEAKYFAYAKYIIIDLGRYDELRYGDQHFDLNSHCETIDCYHAMLALWNTFTNKNELTKDQIEGLLKVGCILFD